MNYSNFEYLNISGNVLDVNKFTEQIILQETTTIEIREYSGVNIIHLARW